ncbi:MAG: DUF1365 family protein [Pirellulales bacterium]
MRKQPLDATVRELVESRLGFQPAGPIRLLTNLRMLGLRMNPVSFYYCYAGDGTKLEALVAEVTNTPWDERHCYVLDLRDSAVGLETRRSSQRVSHLAVSHSRLRLPLADRHAGGATDPPNQLGPRRRRRITAAGVLCGFEFGAS